MPKRVIDFDAMWGSDKLAACAEWAQAEYAWLYGLADASGSFELTNLRVIWGRVAAIRRNLALERLEQIFDEFHDKGLLFVWEENGKRYGHWTGSDVPGRLPPPSWRMRLERLAPPVPKQQLTEFMSRFARGRAASPGGGFRSEPFVEPLKAPLNHGVEAAQTQDWNWNRNREKEEKGEQHPWHAQTGSSITETRKIPLPYDFDSHAKTEPSSSRGFIPPAPQAASTTANAAAAGAAAGRSPGAASAPSGGRDGKPPWLLRELTTGQGPVCGPAKLKRAALEKIRVREGTRSS
jgi:hypothetical protein